MPRKSYQKQSEQELQRIHFRKCCRRNEIYKYGDNECIEIDENMLPTKQYPINFIHDDISA